MSVPEQGPSCLNPAVLGCRRSCCRLLSTRRQALVADCQQWWRSSRPCYWSTK